MITRRNYHNVIWQIINLQKQRTHHPLDFSCFVGVSALLSERFELVEIFDSTISGERPSLGASDGQALSTQGPDDAWPSQTSTIRVKIELRADARWKRPVAVSFFKLSAPNLFRRRQIRRARVGNSRRDKNH